MTFPQRIAAGSIEHLLGEGEKQIGSFGDAKVYLSGLIEMHLKIKTERDIELLTIPKWPPVTEREIFTTEGFIELVDRALLQTDFYIGHLTFLGYAGFFRYPQIRGKLYQSLAVK